MAMSCAGARAPPGFSVCGMCVCTYVCMCFHTCSPQATLVAGRDTPFLPVCPRSSPCIGRTRRFVLPVGESWAADWLQAPGSSSPYFGAGASLKPQTCWDGRCMTAPTTHTTPGNGAGTLRDISFISANVCVVVFRRGGGRNGGPGDRFFFFFFAFCCLYLPSWHLCT